LLDAAQRIVERDGVAALTVSALTKEAGVSRPVVYEHFRNSEAIAIALIEHYFASIVELVDTRTRDAATLDEYLARAIDAEFEYHRDKSAMVRNLTQGHATSRGLDAAYQELRQRTVDTFVDLLSQQGADDKVARVGGFALAELIPGVVYQFASDAHADLAKDTLSTFIKGAIHAIVPELGARPQTPAKVLRASRIISKLRDANERDTDR